MTTYATLADLTARLSSGYTAPAEADADKMLLKASELMDYVTRGRAAAAWDEDDASDTSAALTRAVCDQVEYWLEVGEEHDVLGLRGMLNAGRVQVQNMPGIVGKRALRTLMTAGLYDAAPALF